jgi:hypothetical protein
MFPLIEAVAKIKKKEVQRVVLRHLSKNRRFVSCLQEIAKNTIAGNLPLTKFHKKRLNKHSTVVRGLVKKRKVQQSGGFIGAVLPLLASIVGDILLTK